jgi:DNA-binding NtrC family response regulator
VPVTEVAKNGARAVLVVEDELIVRDVVATILRTHGYRVMTATDGQQARELFHRHAAELILLVVDIALPRASGPDLIHRLPTLSPRIPVIYITGLGERQWQVEEARQEHVPVLQKPFTANGLMQTVQRMMQPSQAAAPTIPQYK